MKFQIDRSRYRWILYQGGGRRIKKQCKKKGAEQFGTNLKLTIKINLAGAATYTFSKLRERYSGENDFCRVFQFLVSNSKAVSRTSFKLKNLRPFRTSSRKCFSLSFYQAGLTETTISSVHLAQITRAILLNRRRSKYEYTSLISYLYARRGMSRWLSRRGNGGRGMKLEGPKLRKITATAWPTPVITVIRE